MQNNDCISKRVTERNTSKNAIAEMISEENVSLYTSQNGSWLGFVEIPTSFKASKIESTALEHSL